MRPILAKIAKGLQENPLEEGRKIAQSQTSGECQQDIIYCMANTGRSVSIGQNRRTDANESIANTLKLDWTLRKNGISFINRSTDDALFFSRVGPDRWYADTPIRLTRIEGMVWASFVDEPTVKKMLELFFSESDWFSATRWFESPDPFEDLTPFGTGGND